MRSEKWMICVAIAVGLALGSSAPAAAQEQTGSIEGMVTDVDGGALPGVTVEGTALQLAGTAVAVTDSRGAFRFPALPPGTYSLTATLEGFSPKGVEDVDLSLGQLLQVEIVLELGAVTETLTVTGERPLIDVKQSATATSLTADVIEVLPRGRDFTSIVAYTASAMDDRATGGIQIDGSSGAENRFIVDGVDTTDLQVGTARKQVITDFIAEVQVKSTGYAAEFGGSTGGVISVITKTGGNSFKGDVRALYTEDSLQGRERPILQRNVDDTEVAEQVTYPRDSFDRVEPGFSLGGPILRDKLWFFGSYQPQREDLDRTVDFTTGDVRTFNRKRTYDYGTANVSGNVGSKVLFKVGANFSPYQEEGILPGKDGRSNADANYAIDEDREDYSYSGYVDYIPTAKWLVSGRAGRYKYDVRETGVPTSLWQNYSTSSLNNCEVYPDIPSEFCHAPGWANISTNDGTLFDVFQRDSAQVDVSFYPTAAGDHRIKLGVQREDYSNDVLDGYQAPRILYYWGRSYTTTEGEQVTGEYGYFRLLQIATLGNVESNNTGIFLQDSWSVSPRLTLNLGVRSEQERVPSFAGPESVTGIPETAIEFDFGDKVAPRLGFAYDVSGDGKWKAYGSYGVFYDITKLEMPRGSFGGDKWIDSFFTLDSYDIDLNDTSTCSYDTNTIRDNPVCGAGTLIEKVDRRHPSNDPNDPTIDPNLKPMESNELTLGVQHELTNQISVGFRYVHKELVRTIEDVGVLVPSVGEVFYIANPGEGIARNILGPEFPAQPKAVRDYDGYELELTKRFADNWSLHATYLYSRLWGNYSGLASSDEVSGYSANTANFGTGRTAPNVNRYFDALQQSFDQNGNPVFGRLSTDRPHQFKAQALYSFDFGTSIGVNQYVASGTPISRELNVAPGLPFFPDGRGSLGRTPTLTATDLYVQHRFDLGGRYGLELSLNVLNLFDEDTARVIWNNQNTAEDLPLSEEEFFAGFEADQVIADNNVALDPRYGLTEVFQAPREVRLGVKLTF
ncbi:MAG: TonB-dependent receptor [Acidobacteriota bacterium]|nr:TonB-dependent receptor [Acidobacteriota bacterium]MDH3524397.1 TonB-dependent receptor [Acidobacteriota bacterium]